MNKRHHSVATIGMALAIVIALCQPGLAAPASAGKSTPQAAAENGAANPTGIHDPSSSTYDSDCLKCHASILKQSSNDPRILAFHQAMIPYTPGYSARKGVQSKNCVTCHRDAIDFRQESGVSLRRTVNIESCVYCHGRTGPGPVYYE